MAIFPPRIRARLAAAGAVLTFALALLTLVVPDWIEETFGVDPDGGNGTVEVLLVVALGAATVVLGGYAVRLARG